jgi:peptidoglycan-N-acetylglucosamine deacetylase
MSSSTTPRSRGHASGARLRLHRYRRALALLLVLFATELMWRTGAFAHSSSPMNSRTVASVGDRTGPAQHTGPVPHTGQGSQAATTSTGPPVAVSQGAQTELDKLISLGYPVCRGAGTKPLVALTFDDGPGPYTQHTVEVLKAAGAKATFFIVAKELMGWPQLADEPKVEATVGAIGDHTYDHIGLVGLSPENLAHQIGDAKTLIEQHSGQTVRLFRPPYGQHDAAVDAEVKSLGMLEVLWTVDSGDGITGATEESVLQTVEEHLAPGAIVLMHENRGTTQKILPELLSYIRSRGLQTVTVPELLAEDPPSLAQLKSQSCG